MLWNHIKTCIHLTQSLFSLWGIEEQRAWKIYSGDNSIVVSGPEHESFDSKHSHFPFQIISSPNEIRMHFQRTEKQSLIPNMSWLCLLLSTSGSNHSLRYYSSPDFMFQTSPWSFWYHCCLYHKQLPPNPTEFSHGSHYSF